MGCCFVLLEGLGKLGLVSGLGVAGEVSRLRGLASDPLVFTERQDPGRKNMY